MVFHISLSPLKQGKHKILIINTNNASIKKHVLFITALKDRIKMLFFFTFQGNDDFMRQILVFHHDPQ